MPSEAVAVPPACRDLGIGFVAYSPLACGFLTGAATTMGADDYRLTQPRWQEDAFDRDKAMVDALAAFAATTAWTPALRALAWLLHRGQPARRPRKDPVAGSRPLAGPGRL